MTSDLDLKCQAYNLSAYLQFTPIMQWDFLEIRAALDRIEADRAQNQKEETHV